jgi:hypothetical protein
MDPDLIQAQCESAGVGQGFEVFAAAVDARREIEGSYAKPGPCNAARPNRPRVWAALTRPSKNGQSAVDSVVLAGYNAPEHPWMLVDEAHSKHHARAGRLVRPGHLWTTLV